MRHKVAGRHLGRSTGPRVALYRTLVTDLLRHDRISTTEAKAKEIRSFAEKMITHGKAGSLHDRRLAASFITDPVVVERVFSELATRYKERKGGYTRMVKMGPRRGDAAPMTLLELVQ
ncbi:MAG: 50S ribosomal protein L17 [Chloroflexi bacterium]|nr:50S ribosomal protein L17 [Chloroflexota bacterium]